MRRHLAALAVMVALWSAGGINTAIAQEGLTLEAPISVGRVPGERYQFAVANPSMERITYHLLMVASIPGLSASSATMINQSGARVREATCARFTCLYEFTGGVEPGGRSTFEFAVATPQQLFGVATLILHLDSHVGDVPQPTISAVMREEIRPVPDASIHAELVTPEQAAGETWTVGATGQAQYFLATIIVPRGLQFAIQTDIDILYRVKEMSDYTVFFVMLPEGSTQVAINMFYPLLTGWEGRSINLSVYFGDGAIAEGRVTFQ